MINIQDEHPHEKGYAYPSRSEQSDCEEWWKKRFRKQIKSVSNTLSKALGPPFRGILKHSPVPSDDGWPMRPEWPGPESVGKLPRSKKEVICCMLSTALQHITEPVMI